MTEATAGPDALANIRKYGLLFILSFFLSVNTGTAQGQTAANTNPPFGFEMRPTTTAAIGMPIDISGIAHFPAAYSLSLDLKSQTTSAFTITDIKLGKAQTSNGVAAQEIRIQAIPFDLGPQIFPSLFWTLTQASGGLQGMKSPPIPIMVSAPSSMPSEGGDIRDIKPPLKPVLWPFIMALLSLIATAIYLWSRYYPSHGPFGVTATENADHRPAHEIALEQLRELPSLNLTPKPYYERLTDILRLYLERRFDIPAMVLTTTDLIRQMRQAEIERLVIGRTKDLFDRSDLVKFAKLQPNQPEITQDQEAAIEIVDSTKPQPPSTDSAAPQVANSKQ